MSVEGYGITLGATVRRDATPSQPVYLRVRPLLDGWTVPVPFGYFSFEEGGEEPDDLHMERLSAEGSAVAERQAWRSTLPGVDATLR